MPPERCDPNRTLAVDEPDYPFDVVRPPPLPVVAAEQARAILEALLHPGELLEEVTMRPFVEIGHVVITGVATVENGPARLVVALDTGQETSLEVQERQEGILAYYRHGVMSRALPVHAT